MARKLTVVVSQGQSANPAKRKIEEDLVAALLFEPSVEVTVIPHLYDLAPDGTGMLCLQGITGDVLVASWLFPRAARWILDRHDVRGHEGITTFDLEAEESDDDEELDDAAESESAEEGEAPEIERPPREVPARKIYCLDLRARQTAEPMVEEIRRIAREASVQTVDLLGWIGGSPQPEQTARLIEPAPGNVHHVPTNGAPAASNGHAAHAAPASANGIANASPAAPHVVEEPTERRWYPVIDYSRCTNCLECLDFCLFGVYGVDTAEAILVEQPDNCRKGCPACSRVCPANAIIFPQHKAPAIAGSATEDAGGFKIDLSKLFGAPDALGQAVLERDTELVAAGRDAVGATVGMPKRQADKPAGERDDLDGLMDQLDSLDL